MWNSKVFKCLRYFVIAPQTHFLNFFLLSIDSLVKLQVFISLLKPCKPKLIMSLCSDIVSFWAWSYDIRTGELQAPVVKPRIFFRFSGKIMYAFWQEKWLSKCTKVYFFQKKELYAPTLPKIFWSITRNTHVSLFGLNVVKLSTHW